MKCCDIKPSDLNRKVTLYRLEITNTPTGGQSEQWIKVADLWAKIKNTSGSELLRADALGSTSFSDFTIRYRANINETMKLVYRNKDYQIRHINNVDEADLWLVVKGQTGVAM